MSTVILNTSESTGKALQPKALKSIESLGYSKGDTFCATVTGNKKGRLSFTADNGFSFSAPAREGLNIGDALTFQVTESDGKISLRLLNLDIPAAQTQDMSDKDILELFRQSNFTNEKDVLEVHSLWATTKEDEQKSMAIAKIKNRLNHISNNLSLSVVNELLASGISLQSMSIELMSNVLREIEDAPQVPGEKEIDALIAGSIKDMGLDRESIEEKGDIVRALASHKLPVNTNNLSFVENSLKAYDEITTLGDASVAALIETEEAPVLEDVYRAKYTAPHHNGAELSESLFQSLKPEIEKLFEKEDIAPTPENIRHARFLLSRELPLTGKNIGLVPFYQDLGNHIVREDIMEAAVSNIKKGKGPLDIPMVVSAENGTSPENVAEIAQQLTPRDIAIAEKLNIPLTLQNLHKISLPGSYQGQKYAHIQDSDASLTARRQLYEIQLKLTTEAAYRLMKKGVAIDTLPLSRAVDELRQLELEAHQQSLQSVGAEASPENAAALSETMDSLKYLNPVYPKAFYDIIHKIEPFTLEGVKNAAGNRLESYAPFLTAPSLKYGDSYENVRGQLPGLLQGLGIKTTKANIRAAEILSRNAMDVNEENLLQVKVIDEKLSLIHDTLHPLIAANMIRDGLNPLHMHVDQVLAYINAYEDGPGDIGREKIPAHIMALDRQKALTDTERKAMTAIYRALNQIEKSGAAAIGKNIGTNAAPTLKNLLNASKYYSRTKGNISFTDKQIDENFGVSGMQSNDAIMALLESALHADTDKNRETAKSILTEAANAGVHELNQHTYNHILMENILRTMNPDILRALLNRSGEEPLWQTPLEELCEQIRVALPENSPLLHSDEIFEDISSLLHVSAEAVHWMEEMGVPARFDTLPAAQKLFTDPFFPYGNMAEIFPSPIPVDGEYQEPRPESNAALGDEGTAQDTLAALHDTLLASPEADANLLKEINLIQKGIKVQNFIASQRHSYRMPVEINGKPGALNMYIPSGTSSLNARTLSVALTLNSGEGVLNAFMNANGDTVDMFIAAEGGKLADLVNGESLSVLMDQLSQAGFLPGAIKIGQTAGNATQTSSAEKVQEVSQGQIKDRMFALAGAVTAYLDNLLRDASSQSTPVFR